MKIALNNKNVTLKRCGLGAAECRQCCFMNNFDLCHDLALRDYTICRTVKVFDKTELKEVFKL
jgi:hypothetical protein